MSRDWERDAQGVVVVVLAAAPLLHPALAVAGPASVALQEIYGRRRDRAAQVGEEVLARHDADELLDRIRQDERFGELFALALEGAAAEAWEPKLRAMSQVVSAAADAGPDTLDDSELVLRALLQLGAAHFGALARLVQATAELDERNATSEHVIAGVSPDDVEGLWPPVMATLVAIGAATQPPSYNDPLLYRSTPFADRLLDLVDAATHD